MHPSILLLFSPRSFLYDGVINEAEFSCMPVESRKVRRYRVTSEIIRRERFEPYFSLNASSVASNAASISRSFAEIDGIIRGAINSLPSELTAATSTESDLEPEYITMGPIAMPPIIPRSISNDVRVTNMNFGSISSVGRPSAFKSSPSDAASFLTSASNCLSTSVVTTTDAVAGPSRSRTVSGPSSIFSAALNFGPKAFERKRSSSNVTSTPIAAPKLPDFSSLRNLRPSVDAIEHECEPKTVLSSATDDPIYDVPRSVVASCEYEYFIVFE